MIDALEAAIFSVTGKRVDIVSVEAAVIGWCDALGQTEVVLGRDSIIRGFVAWFRVNREHIPLVESGDFAAVKRLPVDELTGGPVLVVADAAGPELAPRMVRRLKKLPGVEELLAFRRGRMRRHRVVRRCRG